MNDQILRKYATQTQVRYLDAVAEHGSYRAAAAALDVAVGTISSSLAGLKKRVARTESEAHTAVAAEGYHIPNTTVHIKDGKVAQQWVRYKENARDPVQVLNDLLDALDQRPIEPRDEIAPPKGVHSELLTDYVMGDPHIGMYAWGKESGSNFDLKIASRNLVAATYKLVARAPESRQAIIWNLGDFFHADDSTGRTKRSGHILDTDSRWGKVLMTGLEVKCACIDAALTKHETVYVYINRGNHDDHTAWSLLVALKAYYRNNPRVVFTDVIRPYQYHEFGVTLFGTTHGDLVKPAALPEIMAYDEKEAWGRTSERYWLVGHVHHDDVKEYRGVTVEHYNTLAAADAWNNAAGYRSKRSMRSHVYHEKWGRMDTHTVGVESLA